MTTWQWVIVGLIYVDAVLDRIKIMRLRKRIERLERNQR